MSTGTFVGSIFGAALGGFLGLFVFPVIGPYAGAMIGMTLFGGIGAVADPMSPDMPSVPGSAVQDPSTLSPPTAQEGRTIPDLLGVGKFTGQYLWYGNNRHEEVENDVESDYVQGGTTVVEGGKGMGSPSAPAADGGPGTHYEYYLTWIQGICLGPVDEVFSLYRDQECIWSGNVKREDYPSGYATLSVIKLGTIYFFFGSEDQYAPTVIEDFLQEPKINVPYRGQCYALFYDCWLGEYNRVPTFFWVIKRIPELTLNSDKHTLTNYDINPAHLLWHVLTESHLCGMPTSILDEDSFIAAADTLYTENMGLALLIDNYTSALTYLESILAHIDGYLRYTARGKLEMGLVRGDIALEDMEIITTEDMLEAPNVHRRAWLDTLSEVKVQYGKRYGTIIDDCWAEVEPPEEYPCVFVSVVATVYGILAIHYDGSLYLCGWDRYGELGTGSGNNYTEWQKFGEDADWEMLATYSVSWNWSSIIRKGGKLYVSGNNEMWGMLGMGLPIENVDGWTERNSLDFYGNALPDEFDSPKMISISTYSSVVLLDDGRMYGAGLSGDGNLGLGNFDASYPDYPYAPASFIQLGDIDGTPDEDWVYVSVGDAAHTLAIKSDGTLWGTGVNDEYQLGLPLPDTIYSFTQIGTDTDWVAVACARFCSYALKSDGTLWVTGVNWSGQLGLGYCSNVTEFTKSACDVAAIFAGEVAAAIIKTDGTLWVTGASWYTELGMGRFYKSLTNYRFPSIVCWTRVDPDTDWDFISFGQYHTVALKTDGHIWVAGYNRGGSYSYLGVGTEYYEIARFREVDPTGECPPDVYNQLLWVSAREEASFAQIGPNLYAAGNVGGMWFPDDLAIEWQRISTDKIYVKGESGYFFTILLDNDGVLYVFGEWIGHDYSELVEIASEVSYISAFGYSNVMIIKEDGTLWAYGSNNYYCLGLTAHATECTQIGTDTDWAICSVGYYCSAAIKTDGSLWITGQPTTTLEYQTFTQIGEGTEWVEVKTLYRGIVAKNADGFLFGMGRNQYGELGLGHQNEVSDLTYIPTADTIKSFDTGDHHVVAVTDNGDLYGWGYNRFQQTGIGDKDDVGEVIVSPTLSKAHVGAGHWTLVRCGKDNSFAINDYNELYATGYQWYYQLGVPLEVDSGIGWGLVGFHYVHPNTSAIRGEWMYTEGYVFHSRYSGCEMRAHQVTDTWGNDYYGIEADMPAGGSDTWLETFLPYDILKTPGNNLIVETAWGINDLDMEVWFYLYASEWDIEISIYQGTIYGWICIDGEDDIEVETEFETSNVFGGRMRISLVDDKVHLEALANNDTNWITVAETSHDSIIGEGNKEVYVGFWTWKYAANYSDDLWATFYDVRAMFPLREGC